MAQSKRCAAVLGACPGPESNRHGFGPADFKSAASTSSATRAPFGHCRAALIMAPFATPPDEDALRLLRHAGRLAGCFWFRVERQLQGEVGAKRPMATIEANHFGHERRSLGGLGREPLRAPAKETLRRNLADKNLHRLKRYRRARGASTLQTKLYRKKL